MFPSISNKITILGIDPGLGNTGWGIIECSRSFKYKFIECGILKTETNDPLGSRLIFIYNSIFSLIKMFRPDKISIEKVFVNINPATSEKLIMARTAAFLAIAQSGHMCVEFTPNEIKKTVTGKGHGNKILVKEAVQSILKFSTSENHFPKTADASDALAIALCLAIQEEKEKNKLPIVECKYG